MNNVLVTGGSGAFGNAFVRRLMEMDPERIIIYSRDEHKQEAMRLALDPNQERLRFFIGDTRDFRRLLVALRGVNIVVHAAALKVVPVVEYNPLEGLKTNAMGAANVIEAAIMTPSVHTVIGLSTDKAAGPLNAYGATKLAAEKLFLAANAYGGKRTKFACTRYGNVTGSTGSVLPTWERCIREGKPLPITDPTMTRFWMTLDGACDLVLRAIHDTHGGEVFIPKLPAYGLADLAEAYAPGYPTEIIGIRAGEKLHETLISEHESVVAWENDDGYILLQHDEGAPPGYWGVDNGWSYTSDNTRRLGVTELREMLGPWRAAA